MDYAYYIRAEQHGQSREEACTSAKEALDRVDEMIKHGWKKITVIDEQGGTVRILTLQAKAVEEASSARTRSDRSA